MMPKHGRRQFVTAAAGAGLLGAVPAAAEVAAPPQSSPVAPLAPPSAMAAAAETQPPAAAAIFVEHPGSDYMVDVLAHLDLDYVATMPGSSFRSLHESIINFGSNENPELLTCVHEEISVALAHGYAKVAGRPMAAMVHGVVGLQHASMAIYNAWADRVPVVIIGGNALDGSKRRPGAEWYHSATDNAAIVRDFIKWDAQPGSLADFGDALVRGHAIAITPPAAPVLIMADTELQEAPLRERLAIPRRITPSLPVGDSGSLAEVARLLVQADYPVIIADRMVRTQDGMTALVQLAEALAAPVIDRYGRLNMPSDHPLNQTARARAVVGQADVILGLEMSDFWGAVNAMTDAVERHSEKLTKSGAKLISIGTHDLLIHGNFQDAQRFQSVDIAVTGDGEATLPPLIEQVRRLLGSDRQTLRDDRARAFQAAFQATGQQARRDAMYGWDASPISVARFCSEVWSAIKDSDWALVGGDSDFRSNWPQRLWTMNRSYQFTGGSGGLGVGFCAPGAVGAALAHRPHGRLVVNIQGDGDLMCNPGALWTAVHHKIPLLTVMHNNRAWHQEMMHLQRMANRHERGITRTSIGTTIQDPPIDYAKMAQSMGMWAIGPISAPEDLAPALKLAVEQVKRGQPALIDVVAQGR